MDPELHDAVLAAADRLEVCQAVEAVYANLAAEIAIRRPICVASGKCCHFEEYGHRLYVTTMELAKFVRDVSAPVQPIEPSGTGLRRSLPIIDRAKSSESWNGKGCPYQIDGLCGVHVIRPFGCRIFFCDATSTQWQQDQYERLHGDLRRLHDAMGVPYYYVEWRYALSAIWPSVEPTG